MGSATLRPAPRDAEGPVAGEFPIFEAYSVAVRVSLVSNVATGLMQMSRAFGRTHADARALNLELAKMKMTLVGGGLLAGAGFFGLSALGKSLGDAKEYTHELAQMNIAGMKQAEIARSINLAWAMNGKIPTSTPAQNLAMVRELRAVVGSTSEALTVLPMVAKMQAILSNVKGVADAKGTAYDVAKLLDIRGASMDPARFQVEANMMTKAIVASGGVLTPKDFFSTGKYGRAATQGWSNEFMYEILPTLMQEMKSGGGSGGAGGPGNALMSAYAAIVGGQISKKSLAIYDQLGLLDASKVVRNKVGDTKGVLPGGIVGSDLFQQNPLQWVQKYVVPAMVAHGITGKNEQQQYLSMLFANRTAGFVMQQAAMQPLKFMRDQKMIQGSMGIDAYDKLLKSDPIMAEQALKAQWKRMMTVIGLEILPAVISGTLKLVKALGAMSDWMRAHPNITKALVWSFAALSGAMAFGGTVLLLWAGFQGLGITLRILGAKALWSGITSTASAISGLSTAAAGGAGISGALTAIGAGIVAFVGILANVAIPAIGFAAIGYQSMKAMGYNSAVGNPNATAGERASAIAYAQQQVRNNQALLAREPNNPAAKRNLARFQGDLSRLGGSSPPAAPAPQGTTPHVRPAAPNRASLSRGTVVMDGRKVGEIVSGHQARAMGASRTGTYRPDPAASLPAAGASGRR